MICTTIQNKGLNGIFEVLESGLVEMAEIRLDRCSLSQNDIEELFSCSDVPLVATCRISEIMDRLMAGQIDWPGAEMVTGQMDERKAEAKAAKIAEAMLTTAIHAGAAYADLEIEAPAMMSKRLRRETRENGTIYVRSYHDFSGIDSLEALKALTEKCFAIGADIAKIVTTIPSGTTAKSPFDQETGGGSIVEVAHVDAQEGDGGASLGKSMSVDTEKNAAARVLALYDFFEPGKLIAFAMGEAGRETRIQCLAKGAPYTYAALSEKDAAAPGQISTAEMRQRIYGDFHFIGARAADNVEAQAEPVMIGETEDSLISSTREVRQGSQSADNDAQNSIPMPSSKSFAQRAIIAAALSDGTSTLRGYSACGDNEAAISAARALGASVDIVSEYETDRRAPDAATAGEPVLGQNIPLDDSANKRTGVSSILIIRGIGAKRRALTSLHTGESGLLTRLSIPLVAVLGQEDVEITGEGTLTRRPLKGATDIMGAFGVSLEPISNVSAGCTARGEKHGAGQDEITGAKRADNIKVPIVVRGRLNPGRVTISGEDGSQLISGLMMALPLAEEDSVITVTDPKSIPYLFITMDVMKAFGVKVWCDMEGGQDFAESQDWDDCKELVLHIRGGQHYSPADMRIEGDWSSAANFLVAGALFGKVSVSGLDTRSLQADLSIMDILMEAGASISQLGDNDPTGIINVQRAPLNAFEIDASNCPDLFPIAAVLAAFCQGTSRIAGVGRLSNKESDRGQAILAMLLQMGVKARISGDKLIIDGHSLPQRMLTGNMLHGGSFSSHHDHRMVMALRVANLGADSPVEIDDTACVAKSFPGFNALFSQLTMQVHSTKLSL